jgi:uncharacterized protein with HEPN domain
MNKRDRIVLQKIISYADELAQTIKRFDLDEKKLPKDFVVKNSIAMDILQIGELANALTNEFRNVSNMIPWRDIISLRNRAAHGYGSFDWSIIWEVASQDIPNLEAEIGKIMQQEDNIQVDADLVINHDEDTENAGL